MQNNIIVLRPRDLNKALRLINGTNYSWCYLGQDISQKENITRVMGQENKRFIGDSIQDIAEQQKQPYLDYLVKLGSEQKNQRNWWASDIAYRNPLTSDFFQLWCYIYLFKELCSKSNDKQTLRIIVIQDFWLYKYLWRYYRNNALGLRFVSCRRLYPEIIKQYASLVAYRMFFLQRALRYYAKSKRYYKQVCHENKKDSKRVYIYSWIQDRCFNESGEFHDVYFGRLPTILTKNEVDVTYITPMFLADILKRKCLNHDGYEFIFLDNYLRLGDIFRVFFTFFHLNTKKETRQMKILLKRQSLQELFFQSHLLYYFAYKRWLEESNQEKITIIYPFENQPSEKMLCIVAKELGKNVKLIAYQHSTTPAYLLNYYLGANESDNMPLPQCIVANGDYTLGIFRKSGYGDIKLVNGGALRFEYLNNNRKDIVRKESVKPNKVVLLPLPYLESLVREMLSAVSNAFKDLNTIEIMIKYHPATNPERLGIQLKTLSPHIKETKKGIMEIIDEVDLVVCWSSTLVMEMFLAGIPVIRYCSENTMNLDSLEEMSKIDVRSCYENDMRDVVLEVLSRNTLRESNKDITHYISLVDEDVWLGMINNGNTEN